MHVHVHRNVNYQKPQPCNDKGFYGYYVRLVLIAARYLYIYDMQISEKYTVKYRVTV